MERSGRIFVEGAQQRYTFCESPRRFWMTNWALNGLVGFQEHMFQSENGALEIEQIYAQSAGFTGDVSLHLQTDSRPGCKEYPGLNRKLKVSVRNLPLLGWEHLNSAMSLIQHVLAKVQVSLVSIIMAPPNSFFSWFFILFLFLQRSTTWIENKSHPFRWFRWLNFFLDWVEKAWGRRNAAEALSRPSSHVSPSWISCLLSEICPCDFAPSNLFVFVCLLWQTAWLVWCFFKDCCFLAWWPSCPWVSKQSYSQDFSILRLTTDVNKCTKLYSSKP